MARGNSTIKDTRAYNTGRIDNHSMISGIKKDRAELKKEMERRRSRDAELVVVKFKNLETPGGVLRFSYKRYAQDPIERYEFFDGEVYQIPRGVRDHLAKGCYSLIYQPLQGFGESKFNVQGGAGNMYSKGAMQASKKNYRFQMLGLDYMDEDLDLPEKEVIQVSYASPDNLK